MKVFMIRDMDSPIHIFINRDIQDRLHIKKIIQNMFQNHP
ncbi:hypothetical protein SDC9_191723 [bioreactor metagenome]|uniref:Uncharacterized protein n=1 Tax=bioreactor metagenome TaxID=1076179 RepID=A0A645I092_9ZZZZ